MLSNFLKKILNLVDFQTPISLLYLPFSPSGLCVCVWQRNVLFLTRVRKVPNFFKKFTTTQGPYTPWCKTESWAHTNRTFETRKPVYSCNLKIQIHKFDIARKTSVAELGNLNPRLKKTTNFSILSLMILEQGLYLV